MRCEDVIRKLEELSPVSYAESWDNPGLLAGRKDKEIKKIYIALDATTEAIEEAIRVGADMLLTHHPLIFKGIKKVNSDDFVGRRIFRLIQKDICYYAMHTNFDVMGMADAAADVLHLKKREVLEITFEDEIAKEGFGRIGKLSQIMTLDECAAYVKKAFGIEWVKVFGDGDTEIETAAVLPGSGKSMIGAAIAKGADVLITGDIDHHDGIDALERGMAVIDAGHYGLEQIFVSYMEEYIKRELGVLEVSVQQPKSPFRIM
ncbi:MAG: Nif3-like dinuclear metal center hexameric protein [Lachnospiraceae bacterium]|nr:Nif3-like dinuclear metal center hexameric protein [Lachnospiraceae bacterium]